MSRILSLFLGVLAAALPLTAQSGAVSAPVAAPHVTVQLVGKEAAVSPSGVLDAGLYFKVEPSWHIYWKNAGDAGEPPKIDWVLPKGVTAGPLSFAAPKRLPLGPLMDYGYEGEALFPVQIKLDGSVKPGATLPLTAHVSWLVCQERCLPGKADLKLNVPVAAAQTAADGATLSLFQRFEAQLPQPLPAAAKAVFQPTSTGFRLAVETGRSESQALFFPEDEDTLDNPAPQKLTATANGFQLDLKKGPYLTTQPTQLKGVVELADGRNYQIVAVQGSVAAAPASGGKSFGKLLSTAGFAFLGGLILNLMPCVFPVLFLKGLALVNSGNEERGALRAHGLVYTAGILASFWVLVAVLLGLRAAGSGLGWGFQFQSPVFLGLMAGLLFFLGLSLAGQFEIGLSMTSAGGQLAQKQGFAGSFFTGVLAVVVATPCTAPFMGAAVGYALSASPAVTFAVFTALALGLAAPYLVLTLQPAWTRLLPRPGAWMDYLKQAVSLPIFATVIWLVWVLAGSYGAGLLAALLAGFLLLAVAGWFLGRWPAKRWATIIAVLILLCVVALDALAPQRLASAPQSSTETGTAHSAPQSWSADAVAKAQAAGQPVFVDFTASWCLSCQVNERVALSQPQVQQAFAAHNVLVLKADWTRHDQAITEALTALGRSGVPAYALYVPGESSPRLLPEVLTPGLVLDALNSLPTR
ncbi:protein-disulfide reductase DsbD family protein [Telmatobacter bradus]|uniref:protein-disulfide reductase DsbD family protein n=1 Tax=Telmatobacter bradus TaxID=474953 RepID=UPI003B435F01